MTITIKVEGRMSNRREISCTVVLFFLVLLAGFIVVDLIRFSILLVVGELLILIFLITLMGFVLRDPPGTIRILTGAGLLVAFSIPLLIELTTNQPVFPANFPEEVLSLPIIQEDRVRTDAPTQFMIIHEPGRSIELQIDFETLSSIEGLWAYSNAGVAAEGALNGFYNANPASSKVKSLEDPRLYGSGPFTYQEFAPDLKVSLPVAEEHLHQWITIGAKMDVLFLSFRDGDFVETRQNITRQFKVLIGSPEDRKLRTQYKYWQKWKDLHTHLPGTTARILATVIGGGLLVWGGIAVLKVRKEIMPGLSTLKWPELGIELAETRDVSARKGIPLPRGVYVVRVNAGSPSALAGLKPGDVIVELAGQSIRTLQDVWPVQKSVEQTIRAGTQQGQEINLRTWQSAQIIPIIDDALKRKIKESFQTQLMPERKSTFYQIGLLLVAVAMVLLPFIYVLLIFVSGYSIYYCYATNVNIQPYVSNLPRQIQAYVVLVPGIVLFIQIIFMAIPLISSMIKTLLSLIIPLHYKTLYSLNYYEEPLFYFFVEQICRSINAPMPKRIDLIIEPGAYASFRRGLFSFFNNDLVLTIGLPLISTLSVQQLGGIIAHEFGHFSQNYGMRLSFIIKSINNWFARVVYESDSFEEHLKEWINEDSIFGIIIIYLSRMFIWTTRKLLWVFMMLGLIISHFMSRQMEFDADSYEIRVAGSKTFEANEYALRVLGVAHQDSILMLIATWTNKLLVNSFTDLIQNAFNTISIETFEEIKQETLKTESKIFDTHPSDKDRIIRARNSNEEGLLYLDQPSDVLFSNFEILARDVTYRFYQDEFGEIKNVKLLLVDEYLDHYSSNQKKYQEYLESLFK